MIRIVSPRHGAIVNRHNGREVADSLALEVEGIADACEDITVNGVRAVRQGERFSARVQLEARETELRATVRSTRGTEEHAVKVIWDKASFKRYRFFIDDHVFFLDDIARHDYASLFDCFYLAALRAIHEKYKTRFVLNVFYNNDHGDFDLSRFPDTYKSEWRDNAHWLSLSFHAYSEFPDRPYQYASPEKLAADFDLLKDQIVRFAGEETFSPPIVIHWAMTQPACFPALTDRGVTTLSGQFVKARTGVGQNSASSSATDIGYFVDRERALYLVDHGLLHDFDAGVTFHRGDVCCNLDPKEEIVRKLTARCESRVFNEVVGLASHEQYSFPFYRNYIPDHFERMETAVRFLTERGYEPVFAHEGFLGNTRAGW